MKNLIASLIVLCSLTSTSTAVPYTLLVGVSRYTKLTNTTVSIEYGSLYSSGNYTATVTRNYPTDELATRGLSATSLTAIAGKFVIDSKFIDSELATAEGRERLSNYSFSSASYPIEDFGSVYIVTAGGTTPKVPTINVSAAKTKLREGGKDSAIEIKLSRAAKDELILRYTLAGTAKIKADYTGPKAVRYVEIPKGKTTFRIPVRPIDDMRKEPTEKLVFQLAKNDGYKIGTQKTVTFTITDND